MRRMRSSWPLFLLLAALVVGGGVYAQRWFSHPRGIASLKGAHSESEKDDAKSDSSSPSVSNDPHSEHASAGGHGGEHEKSDPHAKGTHGAGDDLHADHSWIQELEKASRRAKAQGETHAKSAKAKDLPASASSSAACASLELPGGAPAQVQPSEKEWDQVMDAYHDSKTALLTWLGDHQTDIPKKSLQYMVESVRDLRIQRPPTPEEPDLAFRGILAMSYDVAGVPIMRVGGGFPKLLAQAPARARFELARTVAQAWAPCEFAKRKLASPWGGLLKCAQGGESAESCGEGTYSESGWAVSSIVASQASDPGCRLPAFAGLVGKSECMAWIPNPASPAKHVASSEGHGESRKPSSAGASHAWESRPVQAKHDRHENPEAKGETHHESPHAKKHSAHHEDEE